MKPIKRFAALLLAVLMALSLLACGAPEAASPTPTTASPTQSQALAPQPSPTEAPPPEESEAPLPDPDGWYYDLEGVVLYLDAYGVLPSNFITKNEARELGWEGGPVERFLEGAAIGGDRFGNREGLLPKAEGRFYTECDLDTNGANSRGAKRLVFSNDGLYFYTDDHYESFRQLYVTEEGTIAWK